MSKLVLSLAIILGLAGPVIADAGPVTVPAFVFDAGPEAPGVTVNAGSGSTVNVTPTPLPDPVADTTGALEALWRLYKDGQLVALFYLLGFFALVYAERKIKWLGVGYRKVAVTSLLVGLGMIAERAVSGSTPNASMLVGALGASALFAFKAVGPKPTPAPAT
jgi:hypothetical protein